jgi:hypothetical protein
MLSHGHRPPRADLHPHDCHNCILLRDRRPETHLPRRRMTTILIASLAYRSLQTAAMEDYIKVEVFVLLNYYGKELESYVK